MVQGNISINPTQAVSTVSTLTHGQEAVMQVRSRLATVGTSIGATYKFHWDLSQYVTSLKAQAESVTTELAELQEAVVSTIADLGEQDALLAQQTSTFLAGVETIAIPASTPIAPTIFPSAATGIG